MNACQIPHSHGWIVSDIIDDHLFVRTYYGYSKAEALARFADEVSE